MIGGNWQVLMGRDVQVGDVVQTRKAHPCGGDRWEIYRVGADIGLRCQQCGRRVMLPRREFNKNVKRWISPPTSEDPGPKMP